MLIPAYRQLPTAAVAQILAPKQRQAIQDLMQELRKGTLYSVESEFVWRTKIQGVWYCIHVGTSGVAELQVENEA